MHIQLLCMVQLACEEAQGSSHMSLYLNANANATTGKYPPIAVRYTFSAVWGLSWQQGAAACALLQLRMMTG